MTIIILLKSKYGTFEINEFIDKYNLEPIEIYETDKFFKLILNKELI